MKSTIIQRLDVAISAAPSIVLHSNSPSAILSEMGRNGVYKASQVPNCWVYHITASNPICLYLPNKEMWIKYLQTLMATKWIELN